VITGDEVPDEFVRRRAFLTRRSLTRLVHATMLAEFGRDFLVRRDAVAVLLHFAQFHVACIMRGMYLPGRA
jgi:hypothetical protein